MATFSLNLETNALDSLIHAIEHYQWFLEEEQDRDLKYVVLHTFHALELFLKTRLAQDHPLLIYDRPEEKIEGARTVDFGKLQRRLMNVGVDLTEYEKPLNSLRRTRNDIEHHSVHIPRRQLEDYLGRALYFLDNFLHDELELNLKEILSAELDDDAYRLILEQLYTYRERLERVEQELRKHVRIPGTEERYEQLTCPQCGEMTILLPDPSRDDDQARVHCYFCETLYPVHSCELCGGAILEWFTVPEDDDFDLRFCEDCQENYIFGRD